jgi:hypothetical protein
MRARTGSTLAAAALLAGFLGCSGGGPAPSPVPEGPLACAGRAAPFADRLLVGFSGGDATAERPGFALRYQYVAGALAPDPACTAPGRARAEGCGTAWWGTWQWDQLPPGQFVRDFVAAAAARDQLPMITYYVLLPASGVTEGRPEVEVAARDAAFMARYLDDFRFLLLQIGAARAVVHVEPDFWGYAQHAAAAAGTGAAGLPAAVASAFPAECGALPDTVAGLGRCMVHLARLHAPNALVGLHGSAWASGFDCVQNRDPSLDVEAEARETAAFLAACGAGEADLAVVDLADRDAGYRASLGQDRWLDPDDRVLPTYAQAFRWSRALAGALGRPVLWWQLPVGNMALPDRAGAWHDTTVDHFFAHPDRVAESGAIGMAFGAGDGNQTTPESDGGHLRSVAAALAAAGGQPLCP